MTKLAPSPIRLAIVGIGNCASALVQGIGYYATPGNAAAGLMFKKIGGWGVGDIEPVAAFDIDSRKVGRPLGEAIFSPPNNTVVFHRPDRTSGVIVQMGPPLDGVSPHMMSEPPDRRFDPARLEPVDVVRCLREAAADVLVNYLPVGAQKATEHYASACLEAGVALVNCVPVFVVSEPSWAEQFRRRGIPCVGDDIKAQLGATITHRALARLFEDRGVTIESTYQLNTGGNTDFNNMLDRSRLADKRLSKTEAVQSLLGVPLPDDQIHIGPSDFVPFLKDNKICFLRLSGRGFGGVPMDLELRLSVEDSPNSAGVVVDAVRCCQLARQRGLAGPIEPVCAWTMKRPPRQMPDSDALAATRKFIEESAGVARRSHDNPHS